ncbi:MAG: glycerol-3-phosphate dehydrogenase/oxidase [Anaerolineae bacterium]
MTRETTLELLKSRPNISVLIIGGGVNGIGTFRDLALQGVDVLLVDMEDFCSGASAASSHMVHGGLRYLENGEFRLVREALHERNRLLKNAPHQVKPLPTTIPIFSWFSGMLNAPLKFIGLRDKPSQRGAIVIKIGLTLYDWFTGREQTMPGHSFNQRGKALARRPGLNPSIINTATYYDAWMPYPERICMELILDAEAASPDAHAVNYMKAIGTTGEEVILEDRLTRETYSIRPQIVINAAGPWIDFANKNLRHTTHFIGGTKGSHLVVDHPELHAACQGHEMFFENADGRITLFFPLMDRVLIGTTDIRIDNPDEAITTDEEIDYLLGMVRIVFPHIEVKRSDIVFHFSGVRPLPSSESSTTGQISRDHSIRTVEAGSEVKFPVLSLVGGKWTTFRAFAEQAADDVLKRLGRARKLSTADVPIGGGKDYPHNEEQRWLAEHQLTTGLSRERLETLFSRYGTRTLEMAAFINAGEDAPLRARPDYSRRELLYLAEREKVVHLDDLLLRRSLIAMLGYATGDLLAEVGEIVQAALGWSDETTQAEIERAATLLEKRHGVPREALVSATHA